MFHSREEGWKKGQHLLSSHFISDAILDDERWYFSQVGSILQQTLSKMRFENQYFIGEKILKNNSRRGKKWKREGQEASVRCVMKQLPCWALCCLGLWETMCTYIKMGQWRGRKVCYLLPHSHLSMTEGWTWRHELLCISGCNEHKLNEYSREYLTVLALRYHRHIPDIKGTRGHERVINSLQIFFFLSFSPH